MTATAKESIEGVKMALRVLRECHPESSTKG